MIYKKNNKEERGRETKGKNVSQKDWKVNEKAKGEKNATNLVEKRIFFKRKITRPIVKQYFLGLIREKDIFTLFVERGKIPMLLC